MIFAIETEERSLVVFPSEDEAIGYCEGLDVEAGVWLFWAADGSPLVAEFTTPNSRGLFSVKNGTYRLISATPELQADLSEAIDHVLHVESNPFFSSTLEIREHIARLAAGT